MAHPERTTRSAVCCACAQQCGILVECEGERVVAIHGDKAHPTSRGFICPKGRYAHELHYAADRVHRPRKRVGPRIGNGMGRRCGPCRACNGHYASRGCPRSVRIRSGASWSMRA